MPTYGYRCPACDAEFDVWQRMSDASGATCPSCGAGARRVFFPAGIVFKGTGFYATDSRKPAGSGSSSGSSGSSANGAKPASDNKPASSSSSSTGPSSTGSSSATPADSPR